MVHSQTLQPFRREISWKHFWNEKVVIFCENAKNMKNATGYFCVKETLFSGIVKNSPSSESIKLIVFECRTGFVFQALFSYSWLLWCCMKYSILPPGLRVFFSLKASTISLVRVENTKRPNKEDGLLTLLLLNYKM